MLQLVAAHQVIPSASGQSVMRQGRSPHQRCTCFIVLRVFDGDFAGVNNRAKQSFRQMVGQRDIAILTEIPFQCVHHDIGDAAGSLIFTDGIGQLGVHQRKQRTVMIAAKPAFEPAVLIGDDAGIAHLTSRRRNGQYCADRQRFFQHTFAGRELPRVAVVGSTCRSRFGGIQHRTAADCQNHLDSFVNAQLCSLTGKGNLRVGFYAAQFDKFNVVFLQGSNDLII